MKSIFRFVALMLIAAFAIVPVASSVKAQGANDCPKGLEKADCDLMVAAMGSASMAGFSKGFEMNYKFNLTAKGGGSNATVTADGTGVFGVDSAAMSGGSSDPMAMLGGLMFSNTINGTADDGKSPMKGTTEIRIVNGNIYFKSSLMGDAWQYVSMADAFTSLSSMQSSGAGAAGGNAATQFQDPAVMDALGKAFNAPGVVTGSASDVEGGRKITIKFDLEKVVASKDFAPVIKAGLASQAAGAAVTDAQVEQASKAAVAALKGSVFEIYWVVAKDKTVGGFGLNVAVKIDDATAKMMGSTSGGDLAMTFDIKFSKVGTAVKVEAPAGATKLDLGGMMGGSMGAAPTPAK